MRTAKDWIGKGEKEVIPYYYKVQITIFLKVIFSNSSSIQGAQWKAWRNLKGIRNFFKKNGMI